MSNTHVAEIKGELDGASVRARIFAKSYEEAEEQAESFIHANLLIDCSLKIEPIHRPFRLGWWPAVLVLFAAPLIYGAITGKSLGTNTTYDTLGRTLNVVFVVGVLVYFVYSWRRMRRIFKED